MPIRTAVDVARDFDATVRATDRTLSAVDAWTQLTAAAYLTAQAARP